MSQRDLLDKAAECARAIETTGDPERRGVLAMLQKLWTNLANEAGFLGVDALAEEIAKVEGIHAQVVGLVGKAKIPAK